MWLVTGTSQGGQTYSAASFSGHDRRISQVRSERSPEVSRVIMTSAAASRHSLSHLVAEELVALSGDESKLDLLLGNTPAR